MGPTMLCPQTRDELLSLLDALLNETISAEQFQRLQAILLADQEARDLFRQYLTLHQQLRRCAEAVNQERLAQLTEGPPLNPASSPSPSNHLRLGMLYGFLLAVGLGLVAGTLWFRHSRADVPTASSQVSPTTQFPGPIQISSPVALPPTAPR